MRSARLVSLVLSGLLLAGVALSVTRTPVFARGDAVTCGWCWDFLEGEPGQQYWIHHFPSGGDLCGWPPGEECSRCGGTSSCHTNFEPGECHMACGGQGFVAVELKALIAANDAAGVAELIQSASDEYVLAYAAERLAVEVVTSCNPGMVAESVALDAAFAADLSRFLSHTD